MLPYPYHNLELHFVGLCQQWSGHVEIIGWSGMYQKHANRCRFGRKLPQSYKPNGPALQCNSRAVAFWDRFFTVTESKKVQQWSNNFGDAGKDVWRFEWQIFKRLLRPSAAVQYVPMGISDLHFSDVFIAWRTTRDIGVYYFPPFP